MNVPKVLLWALCSTAAKALDGDINNLSADDLLAGWTAPAEVFPANDPWALPLVDGCPVSCDSAGADSADWTQLYDRNHLALCDKPLLFKFNVHNEPNQFPTIRACTLSGGHAASKNSQPTRRAANIAAAAKCGAGESTATVTIRAGPAGLSDQGRSDAAAAVDILIAQLASKVECGATTLFARSGTAVVGLYAGADVKKDRAATLLSKYTDNVRSGSESLEICDAKAKTASALGVFAVDSVADIEKAQKALATWSSGDCLSGSDSKILDKAAELGILQSTVTASNATASNSTISTDKKLIARDVCWPMKVESGDGCASLASKCGISGYDFSQYNDPKICSSLKPGQYVCCTKGTLPDMTPKPNSDGSCQTGTVKANDGCWALTDRYGITEKQLNDWNKETWGWAGCGNLQQDQVFCVSPGSPPMPAPLEGALCGPQMPGTRKLTPPFGLKEMAALNPCPLNACCGGWGFCGTTAEFCTEAPESAGNLGAHPPGVAGCLSNCNMDIKKSDPPASPVAIGYFQGYNVNKRCGRADIRSIDVTKYTHIHFAFATVTANTYEVDIGPVVNQFHYFKEIKGTKRILSFGGWTFSTDPSTYGIFRSGVTAEHRDTMASNIAKFINDNGLDGVDIDWEYPAAPDIPGIPSADPNEGLNYFLFMLKLKRLLGKDKSVSFAAPASYWYLKGFPIAAIAHVVDYIVYMTYDLHGQWDYNNKWTDPGCAGGNCLRSHVNLTETINALSMITKAGVPANKVAVGITSYGRSFRMTTPGCTGPMCTYVGPESGAAKGPCTDTAGYIGQNEIDDIIKNNPSAKVTDEGGSSILVYNDVEWVAYLSEDQKKQRASFYRIFNFLGTSDWAVDMGSLSTIHPISNSKWYDHSYDDLYSHYGAAFVKTHHGCREGDRLKYIKESWDDAGDLAVAFFEWKRDNKYQRVMDNYFGTRSRQREFFGDSLMQNVERHSKLHFGQVPGIDDPPENDIYVYIHCDIDSLPSKVSNDPKANPRCKKPDPRYPDDRTKDNDVAASTFRYPAGFWGQTSTYYILLCPGFLQENSFRYKQFRSLSETVDYAGVEPEVRNNIYTWSSGIRAVTMFHECAHFQDISYPDCGPKEEYDPKEIVRRAREGYKIEYNDNVANAHSWAISAVLIYLWRKWPDLGVILPRPFKDKPLKRGLDLADDGDFDDFFNETSLAIEARDDGDDYDPHKYWEDQTVDDYEGFEPSRLNPADFDDLDITTKSWPAERCQGGYYDGKWQCQLNCGKKSPCSFESDKNSWYCGCEGGGGAQCPGGHHYDTEHNCNHECAGGHCQDTSDGEFVCICLVPGPP